MKRIMAVTAVVLIALLVLGLGFARWFDTLTVNTAVNTGNVDVEFGRSHVRRRRGSEQRRQQYLGIHGRRHAARS